MSEYINRQQRRAAEAKARKKVKRMSVDTTANETPSQDRILLVGRAMAVAASLQGVKDVIKAAGLAIKLHGLDITNGDVTTVSAQLTEIEDELKVLEVRVVEVVSDADNARVDAATNVTPERVAQAEALGVKARELGSNAGRKLVQGTCLVLCAPVIAVAAVSEATGFLSGACAGGFMRGFFGGQKKYNEVRG